MWREIGEASEGTEESFRAVPELTVAGVFYQSWQEAVEREVTVSMSPFEMFRTTRFSFPGSSVLEPLAVPAAIRRRHEALEGVVEIESVPVTPDVFKLIVRVSNHTPISPAQRARLRVCFLDGSSG
jgi:hypothetical protein